MTKLRNKFGKTLQYFLHHTANKQKCKLNPQKSVPCRTVGRMFNWHQLNLAGFSIHRLWFIYKDNLKNIGKRHDTVQGIGWIWISFVKNNVYTNISKSIRCHSTRHRTDCLDFRHKFVTEIRTHITQTEQNVWISDTNK